MSKLDELKSQFIVDAPPKPRERPKIYVPPSPRGLAPKNGRQLLRWMIEEADEQHQLGQSPATVQISKADLKALRYLEQWIKGKERR